MNECECEYELTGEEITTFPSKWVVSCVHCDNYGYVRNDLIMGLQERWVSKNIESDNFIHCNVGMLCSLANGKIYLEGKDSTQDFFKTVDFILNGKFLEMSKFGSGGSELEGIRRMVSLWVLVSYPWLSNTIEKDLTKEDVFLLSLQHGDSHAICPKPNYDDFKPIPVESVEFSYEQLEA